MPFLQLLPSAVDRDGGGDDDGEEGKGGAGGGGWKLKRSKSDYLKHEGAGDEEEALGLLDPRGSAAAAAAAAAADGARGAQVDLPQLKYEAPWRQSGGGGGSGGR
ncbi:hypothetical protein MNEG_3489 [Monoraphidium neglectum]|jgi:hypothetical protein|uniref:Uncharacterized protein n=1 Tax=Monoraphidium neglectum TaxID=145388 RepID=A0A0D2NHK0_9CHLO|nr:hypothetical protein MNEG_3489 [Monoraphidium neglectum]KIZ04476.1 hypothetical protein MNEG_3489 [Monoraphidium neglectum]|eukprot:XP_013903495.1 hypothetical protein MNEG_3489 [Monoraphidium neglectum]